MIWVMLIFFPQMSNPRVKKLYCMFEDNEAVIKMIIKGRSPTMRHVSRTHRVALDWLFDRINLDSKIQIKYINTKYQLADTLTKGNFTRDEWNHLLCLFNISHISSTDCSETMAKRSQHDSGEERVTAKSRSMMNLIARAPSHVSSSTSVSPGKRSYGSQDPWSSITVTMNNLWKASVRDNPINVLTAYSTDCVRRTTTHRPAQHELAL